MNTSNKTYRIKSRGRFTAFVMITILAAVIFSNTLLGLYNAESCSIDEYINVEIAYGDTLWDIAQTYMPDTDTRSAVHEICSVNGITADTLRPGQIINIPLYD